MHRINSCTNYQCVKSELDSMANELNIENNALNLANKYLEQGDFEHAKQEYAKAMQEQQNDSDLYYHAGITALQLEEFQQAKQYFSKAISLNSKIVEYHRNLGTAYYALNEVKKAKKSYQKALSIDENDFDSVVSLGYIFKEKKSYLHALDYFKKAVMLDSKNVPLIEELVYLYNKLEDYASTEVICREALKLDRNNIQFASSLAIALNYLSKQEEAVMWGNKLIKRDPSNIDHYIQLGKASIVLGDFARAEEVANIAVSMDDNNANAHSTLAIASRYLAKWDIAFMHIDRAIDLDPKDEEIKCVKASMLEKVGRKKEAFELISPLVLNQKTVTTGALENYILLAPEFGHEETVKKLLPAFLQNANIAPTSLYNVFYQAAKFYDQTKNYDKAFEYCERANKLKAIEYDEQKTRDIDMELLSLFPQQMLEKSKAFKLEKKNLIFVVGMPRSGTTLLEKILSSHAQVVGMGELKALNRIYHDCATLTGKGSREELFENLALEDIEIMREKYLTMVRAFGDEENTYFVDKMPQNFRQIGLIYRLFPDAKIIHSNRNAIDTCLSCYFQNFAARGLKFAYAQDSLVHYYKQYREIMAYWDQVLPGFVYNIQYEDLTSDTENQVRKLLAFCDLDWDPACLEHHKLGGITNTASYNQVKQPIYKTSQDRWKNYEKHIPTLINGLKEFVN